MFVLPVEPKFEFRLFVCGKEIVACGTGKTLVTVGLLGVEIEVVVVVWF